MAVTIIPSQISEAQLQHPWTDYTHYVYKPIDWYSLYIIYIYTSHLPYPPKKKETRKWRTSLTRLFSNENTKIQLPQIPCECCDCPLHGAFTRLVISPWDNLSSFIGRRRVWVEQVDKGWTQGEKRNHAYTLQGINILLMEEILHHLGCIESCKQWDKLAINWCRISSINSIALMFGIFDSMMFLFCPGGIGFVSWRVDDQTGNAMVVIERNRSFWRFQPSTLRP